MGQKLINITMVSKQTGSSTVDQRPNVSPLVTFAEPTSTFFVHFLY